ncbi:phosphate ABC transporter permease PstA [uncultured Methanolobus sp.]|uniref:phosphate ABC transporter permease PstA n=1 Tax=uncultured Methanolobus sp. TaxID=218300 RepID=UPI0029C70BF0|nr:phosphate ABC transporter permease PstA [uncultured Methanolobus sp.]
MKDYSINAEKTTESQQEPLLKETEVYGAHSDTSKTNLKTCFVFSNDIQKRVRNFECIFFQFLSYGAATLTALTLIFIIGNIAVQALPSLTFEYLLTSESEHMELGAGIANSIVGSLFLSLGSTILATPIAVGSAIYMKRYAKKSLFTDAFSFFVDVLSGTPSIVLGIFGLFFLVFLMRSYTGGFSLISGVIALAILILPVIERSTENAIDAVPKELEEASYALGAGRYETITKITLPYALGGILTGVVIGVGRAAEESAVVVLTAGYSQFMPEFRIGTKPENIFGLKVYPFQDLVGSLPMCVYRSFEFPSLVSPSKGFAAALVLILIVMFINTVARLIVWRRRIG